MFRFAFRRWRRSGGDAGSAGPHQVLRVVGKGIRVVLVPLPSAVGRAADWAVDGRAAGPILLNPRGARMDHSVVSTPNGASPQPDQACRGQLPVFA